MPINIRKQATAALLAILTLAGCSRADAPADLSRIISGVAPEANGEKNIEWVRSQFLKAEADGSPMAQMYNAMRTGQPDLYEKFVTVAAAEISKGSSLFDAGAAARPIYLARFVELIRTASNDDILGILALSHDQMIETIKIDPVLCVKLTRGEADKRVTSLPKEMRDREMLLMAHVMRAGEQGGPVASAETVQTWMADFVGKHPEIVEGLQLLSLPVPTLDQARKICEANITLLDGFAAEEPPQRAELYRGVLATAAPPSEP
ncbi:MAG: hypothetical protein ABMA14_06025 [Hyphomonadaceae bacterium]